MPDTGTQQGAPTAGRRRGRRPAGEDTRGTILAAARAEFAERGLGGASVRSVARRAGVDPALVRHYFRDKGELFAAGMIPRGIDPAVVAAGLTAAGVEDLGARLLTAVLGIWDADGGVAFRVIFSATSAGELEAGALMGYIGREVFGQVARIIPPPDQQLRVSLVVSQVAGLLVARHVLRLEPLASLPVERVVDLVGPVLQRYLTGPLT